MNDTSVLRAKRWIVASVFVITSAGGLPVEGNALDGERTQDCASRDNVLGVSRTIEIDTTGGPAFGRTKGAVDLGLSVKEVILTFDDGPHPHNTKLILDILDQYCVKATFFVVGRAVKKFPEVVRDASARGHTIANHSWSHRYFRKLTYAEKIAQIEGGKNAIRDALSDCGGAECVSDLPISFFRYPGLGRTSQSDRYLKSKNTAIFSYDICTKSHQRLSESGILNATISCGEKWKKGLVIFHGRRIETVRALPKILNYWKRNGYRVVHIKPKR